MDREVAFLWISRPKRQRTRRFPERVFGAERHQEIEARLLGLRVSAEESLEVFLQLGIQVFLRNALAESRESQVDEQIFRAPQLRFVKGSSSMVLEEKPVHRRRRSGGRP